MTDMHSIIEVRNLRFQYDGAGFRLAIDQFCVGSGEKVAVVGPSGSGKTTLLHLLAGVYPADTGEVRVAGGELAMMNDAARRDFRIANIGMVFQEFELVEYLTVRDNIILPYLINRRLKLTPDIRRAADDLAALGTPLLSLFAQWY